MLKPHARRRLSGLLLAMLLPGAGGAQTDEFTLKAALNYNFAKYTQWPEARGEHIELCYFDDSYRDSFLPLVGRPVADKSIRIRQLTAPEEVDGCQLLFIDAEHRRVLEPLLETLRDRPILTVADFMGFIDSGGMIEIQKVDNRLRFRVHMGQLQESGINLSSQVLVLATEVLR